MKNHNPPQPLKRFQKQGHRSLWESNFYRGLPVISSRGPLVEPYLERLYIVLNEAFMEDSRVFAARVDLRFPQSYWPLEGDILGNDYISRFWANFQAKLDEHERRIIREGGRVRGHHLRYVWAREQKDEDGKPHFHLLILLNGYAFNTLGNFNYDGPNLHNAIAESWANALGLHEFEGRGLAYFPDNCQYRVHREDDWGFKKLFLRASYLTKDDTKRFNERCHPFRTSQTTIGKQFW